VVDAVRFIRLKIKSMRKINIIAAVLAVMGVHAQTSKSSMMAGAAGTFYKADNSQGNGVSADTKYKYLNVSGGLSLGYFILPGFALGPAYSIQYSMQQSTIAGNPTTTRKISFLDHVPGIFTRYYFIKLPTKLGFFLNLGAGYILRKGADKSTYEPQLAPNPPSFDTRGNGYEVNLVPGLVYFLTPKFGLEARFGAVGYRSVYYKESLSGQQLYHYQENAVIASLGISSLFLGASVYFGEKHREESREK
jgi:outer membrane protein